MSRGLTNKQIALILGVRVYTVDKHVSRVLGKLKARSRTEASVRAVEEGLIQLIILSARVTAALWRIEEFLAAA